MSNDKEKEITYLKKLITYGDKLKINTLKYKRELNRIDKSSIVSTSKTVTTSYKLQNTYTINSVKSDENTITIDFNQDINKSYINFSEEKKSNYFYDVFDIKGSFKDANPTKLSLTGIDKVTIYQHQKNVLRIYLKDKTNPKTIYIINKRQIVIKLLGESKKDKKVNSSKKNQEIKKNVKVIDHNILYPSKKIIVIDAGHGGKDSGAISGKRYEKDVVLNIAKYLRLELEKKDIKFI